MDHTVLCAPATEAQPPLQLDCPLTLQPELPLPRPQVALIHLFQAGMFADRAAVTAPTDVEEATPRMRSAAGGSRGWVARHSGPRLDARPQAGVCGCGKAADMWGLGPSARCAPASSWLSCVAARGLPWRPACRNTTSQATCADEVRATLAAGGCPLPLITRAEQAYRAASHQVGAMGRYCRSGIRCAWRLACFQGMCCLHILPAWDPVHLSPCWPTHQTKQAGFDGPLIVELTMLRLLVTIYQAGASLACCV